jgi:hypothetical protein
LPYSSTADLPAYVKKLSDRKQRQWKHTFNGCAASGKDEATCFRMANGVVKETLTADEKSLPDVSEFIAEPSAVGEELVLAQKSYQWVDSYEYESRKMPQEEANYSPVGGTSEKACSNCRYYVSPSRCTVVAGEIVPNGLSDEWRGVKVDPYAGALPVYVVGGGSLRKEAFEAASQSSAQLEPTTKEGPLKKVFGALLSLAKSAGGANASEGLRPTPAVTSDPSRTSDGAGFAVFKQADGSLRWIARYSNAWEDREKEILTEDAHKDYIDWVYAAKEQRMPELWLWHTPNTRIGETDWLDFSDGFSHASGTIDKGYEAIVEKLADEEVGVSHGFFGTKEGKYVTKYRSFEISVLPLNRAAVWTTDFNVIQSVKETSVPFNKERREFLVKMIGEDATATLEQGSGALGTQLKALGIDYKAVEPEPEADPKDGEGEDEGNGEQTIAGVKELTSLFGNLTEAITGLTGTVNAMQKDIETLKKPIDDQVADANLARMAAAATGAGYRASASEKNVVKGAEGIPAEDFLNTILTKQLGMVAETAPTSANGAVVS